MLRGADRWLAGYMRSVVRRPRHGGGLRHLLFCICDHFEPFGPGGEGQAPLARVQHWVDRYPSAVEGLRDADGLPPRHSFFYPAEDYDGPCVSALAGLCGRGCGEVDVHLHHRGDTPEKLAGKLVTFRDQLADAHGCLGRDATGAPRYGFIHGNWALCNSRPDGDWCGVNEELGVLSRTGCYADFTFPSAPSPTQPRMVNAFYNAWDRPGVPDGCATGEPMQAGVTASARDGRPALPILTGPLALNWSRRKWGLLPRLENSDLTGVNPADPLRMDLWVRQAIGVVGRPEWVFVKVHTHGCVVANRDMLLGDAMRAAYSYLQGAYNDGKRWKLHYVTAREMANMALAAQAGVSGDPGGYRDYVIGKPPVCG